MQKQAQPQQQPKAPPPQQKVPSPVQQQGCEVDRLMAMFATL